MKGPRKEVIDKRREQLQKAAYRLICKKGYYTSTIRDIAQEAKLSNGLVHYYFKNKEDLLLSLLKEMNEKLKTVTIHELEKHNDPVEKLKTYLSLAYEQVNNEPEYYYVLLDFWSQANRNERMRKANIRLLESYHTLCSEILTEGIAQGVFREMDVHYTTTVILSLVQGIIVRYIIDNKAFTYKDFVQRVIDQILAMVLKN